LTGNFEVGWAEHEARLKMPSATYPKLPLPVRLGGENIEGKTILICADEGLGDTIQFVCYMPIPAERGARVVLVVRNPLYHLLSGLPGILLWFSFTGGQLPELDMHCPMVSLPLAFTTRLDTIAVGEIVSALPRQEPCTSLGRSPQASCQARGRPGLVRQSNPHE
jgi:hypothetical protein